MLRAYLLRLRTLEGEFKQVGGFRLEDRLLGTTRVGQAKAAGAGNGAVAPHLIIRENRRRGRGEKGGKGVREKGGKGVRVRERIYIYIIWRPNAP
jgi:hypothetical protein